MVPPPGTSLDARRRTNELLGSLRGALPLAGAERWWLFTEAPRARSRRDVTDSDDYPGFVRELETEIVSQGVVKSIGGDELLRRLWRWRHEEGEYVEGEGLARTRRALAGLVGQLRPNLGLPEEYLSLHSDA